MSIIVKSGGKMFAPAPEGPQRGVCVDAIDLGEQDTPFGKKHQVKIVWQSEKMMPEGKPFLCMQKYTASLGSAEKPSKLREHLECWRGRAFTDAEADGFDLERLIGVNCYLQIQHVKTAKGNVWPAVKAIMPALPGLPKLVPNGYQRVKDRPAQTEAAEEPGSHDGDPFPPIDAAPAPEPEADDIPF